MKPVCVLAFVLAGCGGSPSHSSSAIAGSCQISAAQTCEEFGALAGSSAKQTCTSGAGTWSDAECDRTGAVGGCSQLVSGVAATVWYYQGDSASLMQTCTLAGGTFVNGNGNGKTCGAAGATCAAFTDCCSKSCDQNLCTAPMCTKSGEPCTLSNDCCSQECAVGICTGPDEGCSDLTVCLFSGNSSFEAECQQSNCRTEATSRAQQLFDTMMSCALNACITAGWCTATDGCDQGFSNDCSACILDALTVTTDACNYGAPPCHACSDKAVACGAD